MQTLLETINTTRENTISTHYAAAKAEFEEKVKLSPLKTCFNIYAGCVSDDVTEEIAHRFNAGGVKATVVKSGYFSRGHLFVESDLPKDLFHETPNDEVQEETKEEVQEETNEEVKEEEKVNEEEKPKEDESLVDTE